MKTINVDGVDRDIEELIRDKVKLQAVDWVTDDGWIIIKDYGSDGCFNLAFWCVTDDNEKTFFVPGAEGSDVYSEWTTYKEPKPKVKLAPALFYNSDRGWFVSKSLYSCLEDVKVETYTDREWSIIWPYKPDADGFVEVDG